MTDPDYDAFLLSYYKEEPYAIKLVAACGGKPPQSKDEYAKFLSKHEMEKDISLVSKLAGEIMMNSMRLDELVSLLPGMDRTKKEQFQEMEWLVKKNLKIEDELKSVYEAAKEKRNEIRRLLQLTTCEILGIKDETKVEGSL